MKLLPPYLKNSLLAIALASLGLTGTHAQDAKLSQALGFASRLTSDTEMVMGMRNFAKFAEGIGKSETWKQISGLLAEAGGMDLSDLEEPYAEVMKYLGQDAFIAFGAGTDKEMGRLMNVYDAYYRIYYKYMAQAMLASMDIGDGNALGQDIGEVVKKALKDNDGALLEALETLQLPPMIAGCRVPKGRAGEIVEQLRALQQELPPIVVAAEFDVPGAGKFRSWAVAAKDAFADEYREKMREEIDDPALSARIEKIIDSKKMEFSFGAVGDYIIIGLGSGHTHMKLAAKGADSLLSNSDFAFLNAYAEKRILAYSYASKGMLAAVSRPEQIKVLTDTAADVLKQIDAGGIKVGKAIPSINKLGDLLVKASTREADSTAGVIYVEDGLKGASIGGYNVHGIDPKAELQLAGAIPKDAFLAFNAASSDTADAEGIEFTEALAGAVHHIAAGVATADGNEDFAEGFKMYDQVFRPKLLKIWGIMRDKVASGLGNEGGMVVDLNGSMPKIPGVPAVLINEGKLPRVAMFNTVTERKQLTEAWAELVPAFNDLTKSIPGQEAGREFQLPDPLTSEKGDLKTHFMGLPFVSNDFLPSLSISDKLFFLSTSKKFSEELAAKIEAGGGEKTTGVLVRMSLASLHGYAEGWLDLVLKNSKEVFGGNEFAEEEFKENAGNIRMVLGLLEGLKGFEFHRYMENRWRTDWHFHITDIEG